MYYWNVVWWDIPSYLYFIFTGFGTLTEPLIFYSYYLYLIPQVLEKKKILDFVLVTLAVVLIVPLLAIQYIYFLQNTLESLPPAFLKRPDYFYHHFSVSFHLFIFIGLASGSRFTSDWFKSQRVKHLLEKQNIISELALLRSQINPHFLFNTLNNIYTLSYKQDKNAPEAILRLSDMMRYMLYEASDEKVPLEKEISYLQNYIELQKLRLCNPDQVSFQVEGDCTGKMISPMLLIPFIENAFKHGVSHQTTARIDFKLEIEGNYLQFRSINPRSYPQQFRNTHDTHGIGHKNVLRRLDLLYPERHSLQVSASEDKYFINLSLKL
ncbi:MAG: histidine kinase [Bacteroidia bacterium]|nr:histidine kinase [Bacteroidia bacterium]